MKPVDRWDERSRVKVTDSNGNLKKFDFVFTNPPFGKNIQIEHKYILKEYELGYKWKKDKKNPEKWIRTNRTKNTSPQILFLELCVRLLNDGGRLCVVLPESIFGNPTLGYVRQWLLENLKILAVWDCHNHLFLPHTSTKTCILFGEKSKVDNQIIMMSVIEQCGHDPRGMEIKSDDGLVEDFSKAVNDWENRNCQAKGMGVSFLITES